MNLSRGYLAWAWRNIFCDRWGLSVPRCVLHRSRRRWWGRGRVGGRERERWGGRWRGHLKQRLPCYKLGSCGSWFVVRGYLVRLCDWVSATVAPDLVSARDLQVDARMGTRPSLQYSFPPSLSCCTVFRLRWDEVVHHLLTTLYHRPLSVLNTSPMSCLAYRENDQQLRPSDTWHCRIWNHQ